MKFYLIFTFLIIKQLLIYDLEPQPVENPHRFIVFHFPNFSWVDVFRTDSRKKALKTASSEKLVKWKTIKRWLFHVPFFDENYL